MLFMPVGCPKPMRVQGCFVSNREVESVVDFLKTSQDNEYDEAIMQEIERQAENSGVGKSKSKAGSRDELPDDDSGDELIPRSHRGGVEAG